MPYASSSQVRVVEGNYTLLYADFQAGSLLPGKDLVRAAKCLVAQSRLDID
jgi:hypothetical protein